MDGVNKNIREWIAQFLSGRSVRYDTLYKEEQLHVSYHIDENVDINVYRAMAEKELSTIVKLSECTRPPKIGNSD